jgi:hypothetical protein
MDSKNKDNLLKKYKEIIVNKSGKKHTYFFKFGKIQGYYLIDEEDNKWISISAISEIMSEQKFSKFQSKFFDINKTEQQQFFIISKENMAWYLIDPDHKILISLIKENTRQGTPRKFISNSAGEKISIEFPIETISKYEFKN